MKVSTAKIKFQCGFFDTATIIPAFNDNGWNLLLSANKTAIIIQRQRGGDAVYMSIDSAYYAAYSIGFRRVIINNNNNVKD